MSIQGVISAMQNMETDGVIERYAIGGAVGATFYLEPVATLDVDIFIAFRPEPGRLLMSPQPIFDYLAAKGHAMQGEYVLIDGWLVQFLPPTGPLVEEALAEAVELNAGEMDARIFTAEHLAAIALQTGRAKDKSRLLQFLEAGALDTARFEAMVGRHGLQSPWERFRQQFLSDSP